MKSVSGIERAFVASRSGFPEEQERIVVSTPSLDKPLHKPFTTKTGPP